MAFVPLDLSCIGQGNGNNIWMYKSADAIATIIAADYFLSYKEQLQVSDVIICVGGVGGTPTVDLLTVTAATDVTVTVTNGT